MHWRFLHLLILMLVINSALWSQSVKIIHFANVKNCFLDSLKKEGVDSILIFSPIAARDNGRKLVTDSYTCYLSNGERTIYIVWSKNQNLYLKKFEDCHGKQMIKIESNDFWQYCFNNYDCIRAETIRPFKSSDGTPVITDCGGYDYYKIILKGKIVSITIEDLDFEQSSGSLVNINYKHNINLKSLSFAKLFNKQIESIEKSNLLK